MRITKSMLHKDLQPYYTPLRVFTSFFKFRWVQNLMNKKAKKLEGQNIEGLNCEQHYVGSRDDDYTIRVRIYRPKDQTAPLPVLLYIHGGGYITGNPEGTSAIIDKFIETRPCVVIAPDYRKAYTKPFPAGFNDCYNTILWAKENANALNINAEKIVIAGHSAGGGLTAAVTHKARDTKDFNVAFQMPLYPMIDDSQPSDRKRNIDSPVWNTTLNRIGWNAYLADLIKNNQLIPAYAAPIRNNDYHNFPPTITFVGTHEPFYKETSAYVDALKQADIDVAFEQYEGCYHAFEVISVKADISKKARNFTFDSFAKFYDKYL